MELQDALSAIRRRWPLVALGIIVAVAAWAGSTRGAGRRATASAHLQVGPTASAGYTPLVAVRKRSATIAQVVGTTSFDAQVIQRLRSHRPADVQLAATASPETGAIVVTGRSDDPSAAVAWVSTASSLIEGGAGGGDPTTEVSQLNVAVLNGKAGERATLVGSVGAGLILGVLAAIGVEALSISSFQQRLSKRHGILVLGELPEIGAGLEDVPPSLLFSTSSPPELHATREALEMARGRLDILLKGAPSRSFAVMSRSGGEGRSTVAANLAWLGAAATAASQPAGSPSMPLRTTTAGALPSAERTVIWGLHPGAGGRTMDLPAAIRQLRDLPARVVVDAPATETTPQAVPLAAATGQAVIVVDLKRRQTGRLSRTIAELETSGVTVLGVILNRATGRRHQHFLRRLVPWSSRPAMGRVMRGGLLAPDVALAGVGVEAAAGSGALPQRLLANSLSTYGAVGLAGLSALLITPVVVHHLGKDAFGLYSLLAQTSGYLILLNLGFGTSTVKLIAEDAGRRPQRVIATFNLSFFALSVVALVAAIVGLCFGFVVPDVFRIPVHLHTDAILAFEALAIAFAASIPATAIVGVVMGYQRYDLQGLVDMAGILVTGVATVVVAITTGNLLAVALVVAIETVLLNVLQWTVARRLVPGLRLSPKLVDWSRLRSTSALSGWYLVQEVSATINVETDLLLAGLLFGVRDVALFALGLQMAQLGDKAVSPFQRIFFPHVSALSVESSTGDELRTVFYEGPRTVLAIAVPVCASLMLLSHPAIHAWLGSGFATAATVVVILAAVSMVQSSVTVAGQVLVGLGRARIGSWIGIATALVNVGASIFLAHRLGVVGIAWGSLVAVGFIFAPATLVAAGRLIDASAIRWVRQALLPNLLPAIATVAVLLGLRSEVHSTEPVVVIAEALLSWLVYGLAYVLVGASSEERSSLLALVGKVRGQVGR